MALIGNTVRITCEFRTFEGDYDDPTNITLTVYDTQKVVIGTAISIGSGNRLSEGVYFYDYVVPTGHNVIIAEFKGTLQGSTVLSRKEIVPRWTN